MIIKKDFQNSFATNGYLVYDEESKYGYLIDAPSILMDFQKIIEEKELTIEYLLLTHGHYDHIVGANYLRDKYGLKIVAHRDEEEILNKANYNLSTMFGTNPITLKADIYLENEEGKLDNRVSYISTPGHTKGGVCYIIDDKIFSGDTIFRESIGRSDFPTGNHDQLIESIKTKILVLKEDSLIYPGHGPTTRVSLEKQYNPFLF